MIVQEVRNLVANRSQFRMLDFDQPALFIDRINAILAEPNLGLRWIEGIVSLQRPMQAGFQATIP